MKAASLNEIKKELLLIEPEDIREMCMRMAKFRKENKELITYLLFEANNEQAYIENVKAEIEQQFESVSIGVNSYYTKKTLRKILRFTGRQIKYSGIKETELELRIFFCLKMKDAGILMSSGNVLFNIYQQQVKKINSVFEKLPEDIKADYEREIRILNNQQTIRNG